MELSSEAANPSSTARCGRGIPAGGIMPERSFWITFSDWSAFFPGCAKSIEVVEKPPALSLSLWHPTQYWLTKSWLDAAVFETCPEARIDINKAAENPKYFIYSAAS
jgi:hypothetical protein